MSYNYRFSIIPPGAVTDPRVTPRALQVLCLLGRHIDRGGWCSRSQVKMAKELGCGRSTVVEACQLLEETGWIETRRNGRGSVGPETSEHPFAHFSYRVRIDRNDLPVDGDDESGSEDDTQGGVDKSTGGVAPSTGGVDRPTPLEGIPSEGISAEAERDTRASGPKDHDRFARWLAAFKLAYPTAAADDQARIGTAARALGWDERDAAMKRLPAFLAHLAKLKRKHPPAAWRYLEERRWEHLPPDAAPASTTVLLAEEGSIQWRIWSVIWKIARPFDELPWRAHGEPGRRRLRIDRELPEAMIAIADPALAWKTFEDGSKQYFAWRRWLGELVLPNLVQRHGEKLKLTVPCEWPPRKDGTIYTGDAPALSDDDADILANEGAT